MDEEEISEEMKEIINLIMIGQNLILISQITKTSKEELQVETIITLQN